MSTLSLRLPESLHERARELAKKEGVSINQLVATALAEKISALDTIDILRARASNASKDAFLDALAATPDVDPDPGDALPSESGKG
jgi:hypothetical protein